MVGESILLLCLFGFVDTGWRPVDANGQLEYIIQLEPETLEALRNGESISSEIPPDLRGVRRYRIQVGRESLPREPATLEALRVDGVNASSQGAEADAKLPTIAPTLGKPKNSTAAEPGPAEVSPAGDNAVATTPTPADPIPMIEPADLQPQDPNSEAVAEGEDLSGTQNQTEVAQPLAAGWSESFDLETLRGPGFGPLILAAFVSLALNLFFALIVWGQRRRYRRLVRQWHDDVMHLPGA